MSAPQHAKRVLVVEDEPTVRMLLAKWMERAGYAVATACNGVEGLALARQERYDLVITDLVMPEREGIEMISELRREGLTDRVLAVSGAGPAAGDYLRAAELLGADRTLRKPFGAKELLAVVDELLSLPVSGEPG